jgi:hypothetical protein
MPKAVPSITWSWTCNVDRRRPFRLRLVGIGAALRTLTRLQVLGLAGVILSPASSSAGSGEIAVSSGLLAVPSPALGLSPFISERASSEVPGWGHASCRSARGSVPASAAPSRLVADPSPAIGSLAMPRSEDRLAARWPVRSRRHGAGGSPSTPTKARNLAAAWRGEVGRKWGVGSGVASHDDSFARRRYVPR